MTRFKQALVIALGVGLAAIMVVLGFWQLAGLPPSGSGGCGAPGFRAASSRSARVARAGAPVE